MSTLTFTGWPRRVKHASCGGYFRFLHGTRQKASYQCDHCHAYKEEER